MEKKREFYPIITRTVKTLMAVTLSNWERNLIYYVFLNYPTIDLEEGKRSPVINELIDELDRQYTRWNKGGEQ